MSRLLALWSMKTLQTWGDFDIFEFADYANYPYGCILFIPLYYKQPRHRFLKYIPTKNNI